MTLNLTADEAQLVLDLLRIENQRVVELRDRRLAKLCLVVIAKLLIGNMK